MTEKTNEETKFVLRIKELQDHPVHKPGFYWTLDDLPEDDCSWSGPEETPEAAKQAAIEAIAIGYTTVATKALTGE